MIDNDGTARLGDFGITGFITDPTGVESNRKITSRPRVVRYLAPELLDSSELQFYLSDSNPTKESDVYAIAMTTYQARSSHFAWPLLTSLFYC